MSSAQKDANTVQTYGIRQIESIGTFRGRPYIDFMNVVVIRMPKDNEREQIKKAETELTGLISTLLANNIDPHVKMKILREKYAIETTDEMEKEANTLLSQ